MTTENGSSMEMGTSDQVLVAAKRKKTITFVIGAAAMLLTVGVVITLVVLLSGNEGGSASPIVTPPDPTTPSTPGTPAPTPETPPATPEPSPETTPGTPEIPESTPDPTPSPPEELEPILLEDIISGAYTPNGFNGSFTSGNEVLFRSGSGDLQLLDVAAASATTLVQNNSEILQQSSRVASLSADGSHVVLAYNVLPVYRYSFLARYAAVDSTGAVVDVAPPGVREGEGFLQNFVWGPTGTACAFVYLNNVYYKPNITAEPVQLSDTGKLNVLYNGIPDWVYEEEVLSSNNAIWFSPSGSQLAYATFDDSAVRVMRVPHYGVPGAVEYQYTTHREIRYPKPGTTNPTVSVTLRDLETDEQAVFTAPTTLDQPILKAVSFVSTGGVALMWTNRVQDRMAVLLCRPPSQQPEQPEQPEQPACTQIYSYDEPTGWIDNLPMIFNKAGNAFITVLPQLVDGTLYKQIVQVSDVNASQWTARLLAGTPHTVQEVLKWTDDDVIWYRATGVNDTAAQHIYTLSAGEVACFTCEIQDGCGYNDAVLADDGQLVAVTCGGPGVPQTALYHSNGSLALEWESNSELSALVSARAVPVTLRRSVTLEGLTADVLIQAPADYVNRTDVPLLVYVYGGPDTALVTHQWTLDWGSSLVNRWGVAVARIDGRGSGLRGVENMFAVHRKLGTVEVEDQIEVTKHLQETLDWVDSNRTCVWGWSYGGYAASLALARGGDVFRCAIAVAPVVDWRFYDTIYTERYMDTPQNNPAGYANSTLLTEDVVTAYRSKRYMLVHGTMDDNVHYQHAMHLSRLLQRSDVYFTQMSYTDEDHALVGVRPHLYHELERFLQQNML
ncbi:venom dipeptidyl peptidase 4 isoform X6 [Plutella xylostella]|uniref:venom dipeptidyl peptidase 4 isoform X3 n=1 Tax=Plutella xylostella TaxID=51655 RepID=UPI002032C058|nr:venom dipeptidyl peptidase 4 isoform X3 [Plutella xylostella]XP_048480894.1 venom dipeptidyl peptidase 4 isoform X4 [Plutella xylostella]XP_048480895.1 venom dipeptidyl peptidase 4 isoform X5 [Plutella xylostella]XP_048480896.1 venom dipeptidyl peptidase 4 isoform X6 [Plutella xylostella]